MAKKPSVRELRQHLGAKAPVGAIKHIQEHGLQNQFVERCKQIMRGTDGIGWGFNDTMVEIYYSYFELAEDDEEE